MFFFALQHSRCSRRPGRPVKGQELQDRRNYVAFTRTQNLFAVDVMMATATGQWVTDNGRVALTPRVAWGTPKTEYVTGTGPCGAPPTPYHQPLIEHHQNHVQHVHQLVASSNGPLRSQSGTTGMAVAASTAPPVQPVNPLSTVYATKRRRRNGKR